MGEVRNHSLFDERNDMHFIMNLPASRADFPSYQFPLTEEDLRKVEQQLGRDTARDTIFMLERQHRQGWINPNAVNVLFPNDKESDFSLAALGRIVSNYRGWNSPDV